MLHSRLIPSSFSECLHELNPPVLPFCFGGAGTQMNMTHPGRRVRRAWGTRLSHAGLSSNLTSNQIQMNLQSGFRIGTRLPHRYQDCCNAMAIARPELVSLREHLCWICQCGPYWIWKTSFGFLCVGLAPNRSGWLPGPFDVYQKVGFFIGKPGCGVCGLLAVLF